MSEPNNGFYFKDVYCYPDPEEPTGFYFMPSLPVPERDPKGQPVLMLWIQDQKSRLQFGVQWVAAEKTLEVLPTEIVRRYPDRKLSTAVIRLMSVQAQIDSVTLAIGDGSGMYTDLQKVQSSGFSPYSALFNVILTPKQSSLVTGALNGNPEYLKVTYRGSVPVYGKGTEQIDVSADLCTWFSNGKGTKHIYVIP